MPNWSLFAIMPLVTGGPEVKLFHSNSYLMLAYLPSFGRYFSRRLNCADDGARGHRVGGGVLGADADLDRVCARAMPARAIAAAATATEKLRYPKLRPIAEPLGV